MTLEGMVAILAPQESKEGRVHSGAPWGCHLGNWIKPVLKQTPPCHFHYMRLKMPFLAYVVFVGVSVTQ